MHEQIVGDIRAGPARSARGRRVRPSDRVREPSRPSSLTRGPRDEKSWRYGRPWRGSHCDSFARCSRKAWSSRCSGRRARRSPRLLGIQLLVAFAPDNIPRLHESRLTRASSRSRSASHFSRSRLRSRARAAIITAGLERRSEGRRARLEQRQLASSVIFCRRRNGARSRVCSSAPG